MIGVMTINRSFIHLGEPGSNGVGVVEGVNCDDWCNDDQ